MKKYLSIIALATLALVACSKVTTDVLGGDGEETPISFQAVKYLSQTKADPDTHNHLEFPDDAEFNVWAYFHDTKITGATTAPALFQYFVDVVRKDSEDNWAPEGGPYYWPKTGMLSFFALYPTDAEGVEYGENGFSIKEYEVPALYSAQADIDNDLMFAQTLDQNCDTDTEKHFADGVGLIFKHELAKVMFSAKLYDQKNYDNEKVKVGNVYFSAVIDEISISNIYGQGSLALNSSNEYAWNPSGDKAGSGKIVDMKYTPAVGEAFVEGTAVTGNGLTAKDWTKFAEDYYVLPQELPVTNDNSNTDATITVKFTVYAYDANGKVISKTAYDGAENSHPAFTKKLGEFKGKKTSESASYALDEWKINTVYNYRFIIDPFEGEIYFDPCMEDWSSVDADPEIIYKNVDQ